MTGLRRASLLLFLACGARAALHSQSTASLEGKPQYTRKNSLSIFGEYSNDSSHILMGSAENRKLLTAGVTYTHRITYSQYLDLQYLAELRPVVMESDPVITVTQNWIDVSGNNTTTHNLILPLACPTKPSTYQGVYSSGPYAGSPYTIVDTYRCGRQWTYGQSLSPAGLKLNLRPRHRLQPVFSIAGGYLFSTQPIPMPSAGSFNFTLEFGGGMEFYLQPNRSTSFFGNRSIRAEYRFHHISNAGTASSNPGIDNGVLQVAFSFGR